jgi:DNA-binding MarR family transcriptional regulator
MLITERYAPDIAGVLSCFDRLILQGTLNPIGHPEGMTSFLYSQHIKIFDFPKWAEQFTAKIRDHVQSISIKNDVPVEFIRKTNIRKEDLVNKVLARRGEHPGLVCIFSAMESCPTFKPWHNKENGKTFLKHNDGKCLHYYFYFIDSDFGLCYIRVPTWLPCRLQVYINGHNWLASQLEKKNIAFSKKDNLFTSISDFSIAQKISDSFSPEKLHAFLDRYATTCCPIFKDFAAVYHWSIMQSEYSSDILFSSPEKLKPLYEHISRSAAIAVKAENIATFLGRKLHANYQDEMGNHFNTRIEGTRIRHSMGPASIKAYDKYGVDLRLETTSNDITFFKHYRDVKQDDGTIVNKIAPMRKSIYSLCDLAEIMRKANMRYLEFLSALDDPTDAAPKLEKFSSTITENNHPYKGFNFFDANDLDLLRIIARGEFAIVGLQNKDLRKQLQSLSPSQVSRIIRRLRVHGIIKKVRGSYKYFLTSLGKKIVALGLNLREFFIVPSLVSCKY